MKNEQEFIHRNPRMRIYIAREETHEKVKSVISRHLKAMSDELAVELANSIDLDSEFGKTVERFISSNEANANSDVKTEVNISKEVVSVSRPTLPETYDGFVNSCVHLKGKMEGCFPFDISFQLKPFDYKSRHLDYLSTWYTNLDMNQSSGLDDTVETGDDENELSDMLSIIELDFEELKAEKDDDRFWELVEDIKDRLQEADDFLSEYNEDWANDKRLLKFY